MRILLVCSALSLLPTSAEAYVKCREKFNTAREIHSCLLSAKEEACARKGSADYSMRDFFDCEMDTLTLAEIEDRLKQQAKEEECESRHADRFNFAKCAGYENVRENSDEENKRLLSQAQHLCVREIERREQYTGTEVTFDKPLNTLQLIQKGDEYIFETVITPPNTVFSPGFLKGMEKGKESLCFYDLDEDTAEVLISDSISAAMERAIACPECDTRKITDFIGDSDWKEVPLMQANFRYCTRRVDPNLCKNDLGAFLLFHAHDDRKQWIERKKWEEEIESQRQALMTKVRQLNLDGYWRGIADFIEELNAGRIDYDKHSNFMLISTSTDRFFKVQNVVGDYVIYGYDHPHTDFFQIAVKDTGGYYGDGASLPQGQWRILGMKKFSRVLGGATRLLTLRAIYSTHK